MRQHAHLTAMMSIVNDHVGEHCGADRPRPGPAVAMELLNAALRLAQSFGQHFRTKLRTFLQRYTRLALRAARAVKFRRQLEMCRGESEPLAPDVVYMGEDRDYGASVAARRLCSPSFRIELSENELVHSFVDGV